MFQVIVSGGYKNRTICTLKQRPDCVFDEKRNHNQSWDVCNRNGISEHRRLG